MIDKMIDEQIIKVFEEVAGDNHIPITHQIICGDALKLLRRYRAEIEDLKRQAEGYEDRIYALNATNKLLMDSQETYVNNKIKEFARLIIDKSQKGVVYAIDIPDYVIEMTEEKQ